VRTISVQHLTKLELMIYVDAETPIVPLIETINRRQ
jgi:hypothetical protein